VQKKRSILCHPPCKKSEASSVIPHGTKSEASLVIPPLVGGNEGGRGERGGREKGLGDEGENVEE